MNNKLITLLLLLSLMAAPGIAQDENTSTITTNETIIETENSTIHIDEFQHDIGDLYLYENQTLVDKYEQALRDKAEAEGAYEEQQSRIQDLKEERDRLLSEVNSLEGDLSDYREDADQYRAEYERASARLDVAGEITWHDYWFLLLIGFISAVIDKRYFRFYFGRNENQNGGPGGTGGLT